MVKSPPELWAECSDAAALARHLGAFGEIRITRLDPETAVAWEGENVRGTVRIEPAGWGTKVILTAEQAVAQAPPPEVIEPGPTGTEAPRPAATEEPPPPAAEAPPPPRRRRFARLFAWRRVPVPAVEVEPEEPPPTAPPEPAPEPTAEAEVAVPTADAAPTTEAAAPATEEALTAALDSLGQAHHRPYSRA